MIFISDSHISSFARRIYLAEPRPKDLNLLAAIELFEDDPILFQ